MRALLLVAIAGGPAEAAESVQAWATSSVAPDVHAIRAAAQARDQEDPSASLRALRGVKGPLAGLWRAQAHLALEDGAAASAELGAIAPLDPPCPGAPPSLLAHAIVEARARLEAAQAPAAAAQRLLLAGAHPSWRLLAAQWLREAKDPAGAAKVEDELLARAPASAEAKSLARSLGGAKVQARLEARGLAVQRAEGLLAAHANAAAAKAARTLIEKLPAESSLRCKLGYIEGKALRKLRRYRPAQRALEAARRRCDPKTQQKYAMRIALLETRVRAIRGQVRGTRVLAEWMRKVAPEHSYVDDAFTMHIDVLERKGRTKAAREAYRELITRYPQGDQVPRAAWRLAFERIREEDWAAVLTYVDQILGTEARPMDHARARYWRAQALLRTGRRAEAKAQLDALMASPSFYAWMALDRLEGSEPAWVAAWKESLRELSAAPRVQIALEDLGPAREAADRARRLVAAGLPEWAEAELDTQACLLEADGASRALAATYDALGLHRAAQMVARRSQPQWRSGPATAERMTDWRLAYSRPYTSQIEAAAEAEGLQALFLTALSREESTFDPDIVSWAGATGLAQLMPPTAIGAYADVFGGRLDLSRLTEPALNLRLGAHVLAQGLRRFRRAEPLALAAYNGGAGLARRFIPKESLPFDVWVETMTVKETRRYVKRVVETWGIYRWLYDSDPFIDLPPEVGGAKWRR